ncbi:MAG TPA: hypothetical protein VK151_03030 [Fluviicola sp.]|nr:hypothetical protein [Fluviicola sp.]
MKAFQLLLIFFAIQFSASAQEVVQVSGNGKLIADFTSVGDKPNSKGVYLDKYQTLVSLIEGTQSVKCMVRIESTVNVVGVWELNDLNEVQVKVYEVEMEKGITDLLLIGVTDGKAITLNLFRKTGEDLNDLGYNYIEQKEPNQPMTISIWENRIQVVYDQGSEKPYYGLVDGQFREIISN